MEYNSTSLRRISYITGWAFLQKHKGNNLSLGIWKIRFFSNLPVIGMHGSNYDMCAWKVQLEVTHGL